MVEGSQMSPQFGIYTPSVQKKKKNQKGTYNVDG